MRSSVRTGLIFLSFATFTARAGAQPPANIYYPGPNERWETRSPEDVGMDGALLDEAVAFITNERLGGNTVGQTRLGRPSQ